MTARDATEIFQALEETVDGAVIGTLDISYAHSVDHAGDPGKHLFIVAGHAEQGDLLHALANLEERLAPDGIDLTGHTKGFHLRFEFDGDRVENAPPESRREYGSVEPHEARVREIEECSNCRAPSPNAVPPITIRHRGENRFDSGDVEKHHLCVTCSPGHFDDVVRGVEEFGVHDGEVVKLLFKEDVSDEDTHRPEWAMVWHDVEDVDNPYIDDVIKLIERNLIA